MTNEATTPLDHIIDEIHKPITSRGTIPYQEEIADPTQKGAIREGIQEWMERKEIIEKELEELAQILSQEDKIIQNFSPAKIEELRSFYREVDQIFPKFKALPKGAADISPLIDYYTDGEEKNSKPVGILIDFKDKDGGLASCVLSARDLKFLSSCQDIELFLAKLVPNLKRLGFQLPENQKEQEKLPHRITPKGNVMPGYRIISKFNSVLEEKSSERFEEGKNFRDEKFPF